MDLFRFYENPEQLTGHEERDDVVPERVFANARFRPREKLNLRQKQTLASDPYFSYYYAREIIKDRFPLGEPQIMKDSRLAWMYAAYILKERWPEAENVIAEDIQSSYQYARDVIKGPWPKGEEKISQNAFYSYFYARDCLKERFLKGENNLLVDEVYKDYRQKYERLFNISLQKEINE